MTRLIAILAGILLMGLALVARADWFKHKPQAIKIPTTPQLPLEEPETNENLPLLPINPVDLTSNPALGLEVLVSDLGHENFETFVVPQGTLSTFNKSDIDFEVDRAIRGSKIKNVSILIAHREDVLFEKSFGQLGKEKLSRINPSALKYLLASATKQFTAALLLKLVGQPTDRFRPGSVLSLNDSLKKYFPEGPEWWDQVTLSMLLSHTSGMGDYLVDFKHWRRRNGPRPTSKQSLLTYIMHSPPHYQPGRGFHYSNSDFFVVGNLIERVTGQSYADVLKAEITGPLQMKNTGVITAGMSFSHEDDDDGDQDKSTLDAEKTAEAKLIRSAPDTIFAVGNIYSTLEDLRRWEMALFYSRDFLKPELQLAMYTPQEGTTMSSDKYTVAYGYGLHLTLYPHKTVAWHTGHLTRHTTIIAHYIEDDITVIALTNQDRAPLRALVNKLSNLLFSLPEIPRPPSQIITNEAKIPQPAQVRPVIFHKRRRRTQVKRS